MCGESTDVKKGIGPAATLEKFGITPVLVNENVGQGHVTHFPSPRVLQIYHLHFETKPAANINPE